MDNLARALVLNALQAAQEGTDENVQEYVWHLLDQIPEEAIPTVFELVTYCSSLVAIVSDLTHTDPIETWIEATED